MKTVPWRLNRRAILAILLLAVLPSACGSSTGRAGAPLTHNPNAPEWVLRGSHAARGRIIGVGATSGVKNTELARSSAANRARAEISKIMEVYSASLMKDYQASLAAGTMQATEEQQSVQQAIKTFSANLMSGTEVQEYWLDPPAATWYALVELDFERAQTIAAANLHPGTREWLEHEGRRVLDDMSGPAQPPAADQSAPTASPSAPSFGGPPPGADQPTAPAIESPRGGSAPAWIKGPCDAERWMCGVGDGVDKNAADNAARAEIARVFQSNIKAVVSSFEGAGRRISSATGEDWVESQQVTSRSLVSTDKVLTMSEIQQRWDDGRGRSWSLAVIDRAQAIAALRDQIQQQDSIVQSELSRASATEDKLSRFQALKAALSALETRAAFESDLRVIDRRGHGIPPPHDVGEILALLETAGEALSIAVAIDGSGADRVQSCLQDGLTAKGYRVESKAVGEVADLNGTFDVLLRGVVTAEDRGVIGGSETVEVSLTLNVVSGKSLKVVRTLTASRKASRGDFNSAASTAAFQLCSQKMGDVIAEIDRSFTRR